MVFSGQAIITSNTKTQAELRLGNFEGSKSSCNGAMILIFARIEFFGVVQSTAGRVIKADI